VTSYSYVVCDVFTEIPLQGNQLAVFTNARDIPEAQLLSLTRETNFSEAVFVYPPDSGGDFRVRIFLPAEEVPFAGHPLLGAAFVLCSGDARDEVTLETGDGHVRIRLERTADRLRFAWMEQPVPTVMPFEAEHELLRALGVERSELPIEIYDNGVHHVYVALKNEKAVAELAPDFDALSRFSNIAVDCFAVDGLHCKTRVFAPGYGVDEDPASGSGAGSLAVHLARHKKTLFGSVIEISQGTEIGRPSTLYAKVGATDDSVETVEVGGSAVIVARGEFLL
jgi:trans-2,3-dihydro-3-hydroxyanthranilate isomerase